MTEISPETLSFPFYLLQNHKQVIFVGIVWTSKCGVKGQGFIPGKGYTFYNTHFFLQCCLPSPTPPSLVGQLGFHEAFNYLFGTVFVGGGARFTILVLFVLRISFYQNLFYNVASDWLLFPKPFTASLLIGYLFAWRYLQHISRGPRGKELPIF